jgi:uncharacterized protein (TIGR03086 family)
MTGDRPTGSLTHAVELLERSIDYMLGSLSLATPGAMRRPSPCAGWDLEALLHHLADSFAALQEAAEHGHVAVAPTTLSTAGRADPLEALGASACALRRAWTGARSHGQVTVDGAWMPPSLVAYTGAVEVAVHGWDVSETCGHHWPIPSHLAEDLLPVAHLLVTDIDRPARFAAPRRLPGSTNPGERLVAFLGRQPH